MRHAVGLFGLLLAAEDAVEGEFLRVSGHQAESHEANGEADVGDEFGIVRKAGQTKAEGEEDEASGEEAEFREDAHSCPDADEEEDVADGIGKAIAHGFWEEAVGGHQLSQSAGLSARCSWRC